MHVDIADWVATPAPRRSSPDKTSFSLQHSQPNVFIGRNKILFLAKNLHVLHFPWHLNPTFFTHFSSGGRPGGTNHRGAAVDGTKSMSHRPMRIQGMLSFPMLVDTWYIVIVHARIHGMLSFSVQGMFHFPYCEIHGMLSFPIFLGYMVCYHFPC